MFKISTLLLVMQTKCNAIYSNVLADVQFNIALLFDYSTYFSHGGNERKHIKFWFYLTTCIGVLTRAMSLLNSEDRKRWGGQYQNRITFWKVLKYYTQGKFDGTHFLFLAFLNLMDKAVVLSGFVGMVINFDQSYFSSTKDMFISCTRL